MCCERSRSRIIKKPLYSYKQMKMYMKPKLLIFVMFLIFGLLMGLVTISLWLGDHLYGKRNLVGFILGYITVVLVDYVIYSMDYFLSSISIIWIAYLYWLGMIFISTGITLRFLKSIFSKDKQ